MSAGSIASASVQCTYINDNEQYMTDLMCRTSDLIQRYSGTYTNPIIPSEYDWSVKKPVVQVLLSSGSPGMTDAVLKTKVVNGMTAWRINDQEIGFGNDGVSISPAAFAGCFEKINANVSSDYPFGGLRILKNLVTPLNGTNGVLKGTIAFQDNQNNLVTKVHTITIGTRQFSSDGYDLEIYTDDSFILTLTAPTTLLHARLWKGADKVYDSATSTAKTVRWYTYDASAGVDDWAEIVVNAGTPADTYAYGGNSNRELIVGRDAVPTFLTVRAAVFESATETDLTKAEATTTCRINDETDSLYIAPNPTPADCVLRAGETTPDGQTFAPKVYDKETKTEITGVKYKFVCLSPAGAVLNNVTSGPYDTNNNGIADNEELLTTYKVPRAMFEGLGDGPNVQIHAFRI